VLIPKFSRRPFATGCADRDVIDANSDPRVGFVRLSHWATPVTIGRVAIASSGIRPMAAVLGERATEIGSTK